MPELMSDNIISIMKKLAIILTASLVLVVSCYNSYDNIASYLPSITDQDTQRVSVPVPQSFGNNTTTTGVEASSSSPRGFVDITPNGSFGNKYMVAGSVMSIIPAISNLEMKPGAVSGSDNDFLSNGDFNFFGFDAKLQQKGSQVNQDGVYLRYDVPGDDGKHTGGIIEYYYSTQERKFSYRQIVFITTPKDEKGLVLDPVDGQEYTVFEPFIIIIEYEDIPITIGSDNVVSFEAGMENGNFKQNARVFQIYLDAPTVSGTSSERFIVRCYYPLVKKDGHELIAWNDRSATGGVNLYWDEIPKDIASIIVDKKYDIEDAYSIIEEIFKKGSNVKAHDSYYGSEPPYGSYDAFKESLLGEELKISGGFPSKAINAGISPTYFDIEHNEYGVIPDPNDRFMTVNGNFWGAKGKDIAKPLFKYINIDPSSYDQGAEFNKDATKEFLKKLGISEEILTDEVIEKFVY